MLEYIAGMPLCLAPQTYSEVMPEKSISGRFPYDLPDLRIPYIPKRLGYSHNRTSASTNNPHRYKNECRVFEQEAKAADYHKSGKGSEQGANYQC